MPTLWEVHHTAAELRDLRLQSSCFDSSLMTDGGVQQSWLHIRFRSLRELSLYKRKVRSYSQNVYLYLCLMLHFLNVQVNVNLCLHFGKIFCFDVQVSMVMYWKVKLWLSVIESDDLILFQNHFFMNFSTNLNKKILLCI